MHYHYVYVYIITHMWHIALIAPPMRGATHAWQDFRWGSGRGGRRTIFDSLTLHLENWSTDYWSLHWCVFPWQCSGGAAEARKDLGMTFWIAHTLGESWRHDLGMTFTSTCRSSEGFIFFCRRSRFEQCRKHKAGDHWASRVECWILAEDEHI